MDVDAWKPGTTTTVGAKVLGFPFDDLAHMPAGDYYAQALLNVYTQVHRADGHAIWVHADQWEGQHWNTSPGNLVSEVREGALRPVARTTVKLTLTKKLPPLTRPPDTRWVKRIKMKSELLSKFWGAARVHRGDGAAAERLRRRRRTDAIPRSTVQGHFGLGAPFGFTEHPAANGRGGPTSAAAARRAVSGSDADLSARESV